METVKGAAKVHVPLDFVSASPLGRSVELDPSLDELRRARIAAGLDRAHARLLARLRPHRDALDADARLETSLAELRRTLADGGAA